MNNKMMNVYIKGKRTHPFVWDAYNYCWVHDGIEDIAIFIHKYPTTKYLVSIEHRKVSTHDVFDSIYAAQKFIELKYDIVVTYRDIPVEETRR